MPLLDQAGDDEWTTGTFNCLEDIPSTCDAVCCFPCQYGRQCASLDGQQNTLNATWCVIPLIFGCAAPCYVMGMRRRVRTRFGISGSCPGDLACAFFCASCSHCQNGRELTNRGFWPGGTICATQPAGGIG